MRWLTLALVCLAAGLLITLVVAWACAALVDPGRARVDFVHRELAPGTSETVSIHRRFGHTRVNRVVGGLEILDQFGSIRWGRPAGVPAHPEDVEQSIDLAGWPLRAFQCVNYGEVTIDTGISTMTVSKTGLNAIQGGIELTPFTAGWGSGAWRALPYQPRWWGLAADVALWGAAWALIACGIVRCRTARRRSRGLCTACGYDLRGGEAAQCPECGLTVVECGDVRTLDGAA